MHALKRNDEAVRPLEIVGNSFVPRATLNSLAVRRLRDEMRRAIDSGAHLDRETARDFLEMAALMERMVE